MSGAQSAHQIMIVAGEASGDMHGAALYLALQQKTPDLNCLAMGGAALAQSGATIIQDSNQLGVIGIWDVIRHYPSLRRALSKVKRCMREQRPDLLICIDYKEFNFKLAKYAKSLGIKVLFYVSPQVWAWRSRRVKKYAQIMDAMAVIFPFEVAIYQQQGVNVHYVGHPLTRTVKTTTSKQQALQSIGLEQDALLISLLPGSRSKEVERLLPVMLASAALLQQHYPQVQFLLPRAESIDTSVYQHFLQSYPQLAIQQCTGRRYDLLKASSAAICASGTATLELALLNVPMLITYKVAALTYWVAKYLVKTPYIGLPNIIAGRAIVTELIQHDATPEKMFVEMDRLIANQQSRSEMQARLQTEVSERLDDIDGIDKLADVALSLLAEAAP